MANGLARGGQQRGIEGRPQAPPANETEHGRLIRLIEAQSDKIAEVCPRHTQAGKVVRLAVSLVRREPKIAQCTVPSILLSIMQAAALGLEPNTPLHQAYVIPYKNRKCIAGRWQSVQEAQLVIGYRGLILLALQGGDIASIKARVVHERDRYRCLDGLHPVLEHEESPLSDPGPLVAAYCIWQTAHGHRDFEAWWRSKLERHRDKYAPGRVDDGGVKKVVGPWGDADMFEAMCLKTTVRAASKFWGMSSEKLRVAIGIDDRGDRGLPPDFAVPDAQIPDPRDARAHLGEAPDMIDAPYEDTGEVPPEDALQMRQVGEEG